MSFVDCPGHDILMATMLNGAAVMDAALLLIGKSMIESMRVLLNLPYVPTMYLGITNIQAATFVTIFAVSN